MTHTYQSEIIIVGAGPVGSYLGWKLAAKGHDVLLLEATDLKSLGAHIEIFHMDCIRFDEFDITHPTGEELIHKETHHTIWSPDQSVNERVNYELYVMHLPLYIQRLHRYVWETGGQIIQHARVDELIFDDGGLVGVTGIRDDEPFEARGRLIVDATGVKSAVRTRLPEDFDVENDPILPEDSFFVCLELRDDFPEGVPTGSNTWLFHKAFWNKSYGDGAILGIGQPLSYKNAWDLHRAWREEYFGDPGKIIATRQGVVPYRRPPFSLVGNGFMAVGDSACMNKPFSGEGVTSGYTACKIAIDIISEALEGDGPTREALWPYNTRYFRGQGAKFAGGIAQLPAVASLGRKDVDYLFHKGVLFTGDDFEELNTDYEIVIGTGKLIKIAAILILGVISGQFSFDSLKKFLGASGKADSVKAHYKVFPAAPDGFPGWVEKARSLWEDK